MNSLSIHTKECYGGLDVSINKDIRTYRKIKYLKGPRSQDSCTPNRCTTLKVYFHMPDLILISYWRYLTFFYCYSIRSIFNTYYWCVTVVFASSRVYQWHLLHSSNTHTEFLFKVSFLCPLIIFYVQL